MECGSDGQWIRGEWNAECKKEGECGSTCFDLQEQNDLFCWNYYGMPDLNASGIDARTSGFDFDKVATEDREKITYYYNDPAECCCPSKCPEGQMWDNSGRSGWRGCSCVSICGPGYGEWNPKEQACCPSPSQVYDPETGDCIENPWELSGRNNGYVYQGMRGENGKKVYYRKNKDGGNFFKSLSSQTNWGDSGYAEWAWQGCQFSVNTEDYAELTTECPSSDPCKECDPFSDTCKEDYMCYKQEELRDIEMSSSPSCYIGFTSTTINDPRVTSGFTLLGLVTTSGLGAGINDSKNNSQAHVNTSSIGGGMPTYIMWSGISYKTLCPNYCNGDAVGEVFCTGGTDAKVCLRAPLRNINIYRCVKK